MENTCSNCKIKPNGSGNRYHRANVGDNVFSDRVSLFGKEAAGTLMHGQKE